MRSLTILAALLAGCSRHEPPPVPPVAMLGDPAPAKAPVVQDESQPREDIEIEFKARLVQTVGTWTFAFEGKTNLPKNTVVRLTVFYPEPWERQLGDGTIQRDTIADYLFMHDYDKTIRVGEGGGFSSGLYRMKRKPFSMGYRARVTCAAEDQDLEGLESLRKTHRFGKEGKTEAHFDLRIGTDADFEAEQRESAKALKAEFALFDAMMVEMKDQFARHRVRFDEAAWRAWRNQLSVRLAGVKDRNEERCTMFRVFRERRGKFHVADITRFIEDDADLLEATLRNPTPENLTRANEEQTDLLVGIEDRKRELLLDEPNAENLKGPVAQVMGKGEAAIEFAKTAMGGKLQKEAWGRDREVLRASMSLIMLDLAKEEPNKTPKLYPYVTQVAVAFESLLRAVDSQLEQNSDVTKGGVQAGIDSLREAMTALRKFALSED
ncbi:MAG TPA: hypothetical protein VI643_01385 [Planctomycetota bacterium]|nr:hypothetical protein [Planctomycetota bacterium]